MRTLLFLGVALVYVLITVQVIRKPSSVMQDLGLRFDNINGLSEFHAIYVGVWSVTAAMLIYAAFLPHERPVAIFAALMVLAQPMGRIVALFRGGAPRGKMQLMFILETIGGLWLCFLA
ncbi:DUF4345 family protein [Deinococcus roseus]|uniref:DUF4345 domain-containing protein n=1 Tax=Deinococcus roseus TaxID=392414 RepID=A0ABQ2D1V5_9DEIO|nr:DUF4345 family protein [Deinococcus roseus]GGJ38267.1 hypothetical protein GCM10008938_25470 [Deinococcus roseus]